MTYLVASNYVTICAQTLSYEDFTKLLAKNVTLSHQTNEEPEVNGEGRDAVAALFKKYIFDNTSNISLKSCKIEPQPGDRIRLTLNVEENKNEAGAINRYLFQEVTLFDFKTKAEKPAKIQRIETKVKRTLIQANAGSGS